MTDLHTHPDGHGQASMCSLVVIESSVRAIERGSCGRCASIDPLAATFLS